VTEKDDDEAHGVIQEVDSKSKVVLMEKSG